VTQPNPSAGGAGGRTALRFGGHDAVVVLLEGLHDVNGDGCHQGYFPGFVVFFLAFLADVFLALFAGAGLAGAAFAAGDLAGASGFAAFAGFSAAGVSGCAAAF
jgi:hypothetical protein